MELGMKQLA